MKFYKPQLQLARYRGYKAPDEFVLHAVTFCRRTNFRADRIEVNREQLEDSILNVTLHLRQDPDLPDLEYITPVVHTIHLGAVAFPDNTGEIVVDVVGEVVENGDSAGEPVNSFSERTTTTATVTQTGSTTTVSTTDADDKSRPSGDDKLS